MTEPSPPAGLAHRNRWGDGSVILGLATFGVYGVVGAAFRPGPWAWVDSFRLVWTFPGVGLALDSRRLAFVCVVSGLLELTFWASQAVAWAASR